MMKVYSQGAPFHGRNIAKILGAKFIEDAGMANIDDVVILVGVYASTMRDLERLIVHCRFVICLWIGTDVLETGMADKHFNIDLLSKNDIKNICIKSVTEDKRLHDELFENIGLESATFINPPIYLPKFQAPLSKFAVGVHDYTDTDKHNYFRMNLMYDVADAMPTTQFYFFGLREGRRGNITYLPFLPIQKIINKVSVLLRFPEHDGVPHTPMQMAMAGRWSIQEIDMPGIISCEPDVKSIVREIKKTQKFQVSEQTSKFYRKLCSHETFKKNIEDLIKNGI